MTGEHRNIVAVTCKPKKEGWDCDITRIISEEPKPVNNNICYVTKTETESNLESIHLEKDATTCIIQESGRGNFMRCE